MILLRVLQRKLRLKTWTIFRIPIVTQYLKCWHQVASSESWKASVSLPLLLCITLSSLTSAMFTLARWRARFIKTRNSPYRRDNELHCATRMSEALLQQSHRSEVKNSWVDQSVRSCFGAGTRTVRWLCAARAHTVSTNSAQLLCCLKFFGCNVKICHYVYSFRLINIMPHKMCRHLSYQSPYHTLRA
jgi:hypothetical protein